MNKIWANRLIGGTKNWDEVPSSRKAGVKEELLQRVADGTITAEQYGEITGEEYIA